MRFVSCGTEGSRLGFIAPMMIGRETGIAIDPDRELGAGRRSREVLVDALPAASKLFGDFGCSEPPGTVTSH